MAKEPQKVSATKLETSGEKQLLMGGFQQIRDVADPKIQKLGEFAVKEHNKQAGSHLKFQEVVGGSFQIVAGINYIILLMASDDIITRIYGAMVFEDLHHNLHLKDFFTITKD